jgi:outer membrane protein
MEFRGTSPSPGDARLAPCTGETRFWRVPYDTLTKTQQARLLMRLLRSVALATLLVPAGVAVAQTPVRDTARTTLTLEEAVTIARRNSPAYLQVVNNQREADAQVRASDAALLPAVSSSFTTEYSKGGTQIFQGAQLGASSSYVSSGYNVGVRYDVNGATFLNRSAARATRDAVEADVTGSTEQLRALVTQQYLSALQAEATAAIQDTLVATARAQLELARARTAVGAGTTLDVRRAEVAVGQAEVAALTARNNVDIQKLQLFQQMGVQMSTDTRLVTAFPIQQPTFRLDSLLDLAQRTNPNLEATRAREHAANVNLRARRSAYTPTLSVQTGWGGQSFEYRDPNFLIQSTQSDMARSLARCELQDTVFSRVGLPAQGCGDFVFTQAHAQALRDRNNTFPFQFQRSPFGGSATLSLPIFDRWNRELNIQQGLVQRDDARQARRARELQTSSDVTQAYLNLVTAARRVALQEQVAARAREELSFAEERYRVGASTFLDVSTSQATYAQAQVDRVNAIYEYHRAYAALENAVGRPLR